jgi:hypothetical protein
MSYFARSTSSAPASQPVNQPARRTRWLAWRDERWDIRPQLTLQRCAYWSTRILNGRLSAAPAPTTTTRRPPPVSCAPPVFLLLARSYCQLGRGHHTENELCHTYRQPLRGFSRWRCRNSRSTKAPQLVSVPRGWSRPGAGGEGALGIHACARKRSLVREAAANMRTSSRASSSAPGLFDKVV